ncbi:MAG: DUF2116 family Zn-ribbon domain-containing protein [Promethearchaeota archaeon]
MPSWKENLKMRPWGEHKHCLVCQRAIPMDRDFCSQECKDQYNKKDKKKGKKNKIQIIVFGALIVVMLIVMGNLG